MNEPDSSSHDQWWLASLGRLLVWARLRINDAGTAEVLDSDGNTLAYDGEDSARAACCSTPSSSPSTGWTRKTRWRAVSRWKKSCRRRAATKRSRRG